jgi:alpha-aminoadipic semialdehyde synthase
MNNIIGIRREDRNPWERRAPLIPQDVVRLRGSSSLSIIVQPSKIRVFSDDDYLKAGAGVSEDLSPCSVILAVKEIPPDRLLPEKTYLFFSHTTKGQPHNLPMLKRMADLRCSLIDYEKIVDDQGRRLVFFGRQAGQAGMIDTLWALGRKLRQEGLDSPFGRLEQTWRYRTLAEAEDEVRRAGRDIKDSGLDTTLLPLVVGFAGYGHTSRGAQEVFDLLPVEEIPPDKLGEFFAAENFRADRVYKVVFREEHMLEPGRRGKPFDLQEYYTRPHLYRSRFSDFLPYLTALVNCIYWEPKYPRFVTIPDLKRLFLQNGQPRLRIIGDISCDVNGSVECTVKCTDPDSPVYVYDLREDRAVEGFQGAGPVVLAVYNLPAEISHESSVYFSRVLKDFIPALAGDALGGRFSECRLPQPLKRAVVLHRGEFAPDYEYMREYLKKA